MNKIPFHVSGVKEVEYAGWLPIYRRFGDCGTHPQFGHINTPPVGFKFVNSSPYGQNKRPGKFTQLLKVITSGRRNIKPVFKAIINIVKFSYKERIGLLTTLRFIFSRGLMSLLVLPKSNRLIFLTSVPFTLGERDWLVEIEDTTSLFYPFLQNGKTEHIHVASMPVFKLIKYLITSPRCKGILTHVQSTADSLPILFQAPDLAQKISYAPVGLQVPAYVPRRVRAGSQQNILFSNSWHQYPDNFYLRGGLDVLATFALLKPRYPHLELTIRSKLPASLPWQFRQIIQDYNVKVIDHFLPADDWQELIQKSDFFLLPSARIHVVSFLEAMAYSMAIITSDGWGINNYIQHGENGIIVPGRYGVVSWLDPDTGVLRENYKPMFESDPKVVDSLAVALGGLIEDPELRYMLQLRARATLEQRFSLCNWNKALGQVLQYALG